MLLLAIFVSSAPAQEDGWQVYENARFGFVIPVPPGMRDERPPDNGGGQAFTSHDGLVSLAAWGTFAWLNPEYRTQMLRFGEGLFLIRHYYVDEDHADYEKLTESALIGMATSLDRFSPRPPGGLGRRERNAASSATGFHGNDRSLGI